MNENEKPCLQLGMEWETVECVGVCAAPFCLHGASPGAPANSHACSVAFSLHCIHRFLYVYRPITVYIHPLISAHVLKLYPV